MFNFFIKNDTSYVHFKGKSRIEKERVYYNKQSTFKLFIIFALLKFNYEVKYMSKNLKIRICVVMRMKHFL